VTGRACQCEHVSHETDAYARSEWPELAGTGHAYMSVPAGTRRAQFVGPVCDECADTHMRPYLTGEDAS
jgi:hypothetical protein